MAMMKAAVIHSAGGPEVLKIESLPIPQPRHHEVLIRVKAFGVRSDDAMPTAVCLTTYAGESEDSMRMPFQQLVEQVEAGILRVQIGKAFQLDQIVEAHRSKAAA